MNVEEIGTLEKDGNILLSSICFTRKEKSLADNFNKAFNNMKVYNNVADERNINNMEHTITTTIASKTLETTDNREIKINNITISSVGESLPLSGVISIETTG